MGRRIKTPEEIIATKKWVRVEVQEKFANREFEETLWVASCKLGEQNFTHYEFGNTKLQAIQGIQSWLVPRGYEISNMAELMGIEKKKMTFVEWLRHVEHNRLLEKYPSLKTDTKNNGIWIIE